MKQRLAYVSGEEIQKGDQVSYHGEPGIVEFVVTEKTGDLSIDWYVEQFSGGGCMLTASNFGSVFLEKGSIDEDLEFVARAAKQPVS